MKMLKKMAALLLAGVMAMALLTACGGGDEKSFAQKAEEAAFAGVKAATGVQENDAELKKLAESKIDLIDTEKGTFNFGNAYDAKEWDNAEEEFKNNGVVTVTVALPLMKDGKMQSDGTYTVMEITADNIGSLNQSTGSMQELLNAMLEDTATVTIKKVGVAGKTVNGKTYVAIAMSIELAKK